MDCYSRFVTNQLSKGVSKKTATEQVEDSADPGLLHVIALMEENKLRIWNSLEIFNEYQSHAGELMSRDFVIQKLKKHFGGDLIILSSPGYANIIAFKCQTALQLKTVKEDDNADMSGHIIKVAKEVIKECKGIHLDRSSYKLNLDVPTAQESVSEVLMTLLEAMSPKAVTYIACPNDR